MQTATLNGDSLLKAPERNYFFYGKLMDVTQFEKEQRYVNEKRSLLNRLVLGSGVVCGLNVVIDPDLEGRILILPGVAIDSSGKEIVIPEGLPIDPHQLTDEQGQPGGKPIDSGIVEICLVYNEIKTDPVPVLVPDCDRTDNNCAHSTIRERFSILVRHAEGDPPAPPSCRLGGLPLPLNGALHELICQRISEPCSETEKETCVSLARVRLPLDDKSIDPCTSRKLIYRNALLSELSLCLLERIEQFAQGRFLRYLSGDGQLGPSGGLLSEPLMVEIVDAEGEPIQDILVQFEVLTGGGNLAPETSKTNADGRTQTMWTLGPNVGEQQVVASAIGTPFTVTFRAVAQVSQNV